VESITSPIMAATTALRNFPFIFPLLDCAYLKLLHARGRFGLAKNNVGLGGLIITSESFGR
jgi:hypothetical protein